MPKWTRLLNLLTVLRIKIRKAIKMFAKSEKLENVGVGQVPLFAKQTPNVATLVVKAKSALKQYAPVWLKLTADGIEATTIQSFTAPTDNTTRVAVTAFPAVVDEFVEVYVQGFFNVNALQFENIPPLRGKTANDKVNLLNYVANAGMHFDNVPTDPVQRT